MTTVAVVYGLTSLAPERADAAALLAYLRDPWRIENRWPYVRDMTLGEDACRARSGAAPEALAAWRHAVVHLPADVEAASRPEAIEQLQLNPKQAKRLIGIPQK